MVYVLPTFRGYTVDVRLREFRKVTKTRGLVFLPFDTPKGDRLLSAWLKTLPQAEYTQVVADLF